MNKTPHNKPLKDFLVYQDGKLNKDLSVRYTFSDRIRIALARRQAAVSLQLQMFAYDFRHRTHYRRIRNELRREQRNREFESRIGLNRTDHAFN